MSTSRQLAAIMFTDIQGYTALMQQSEAAAVEIRNKHKQIFDTETTNFNGRIINYYGDGTLSIFESAVSAVKCGCALQEQFSKEPAIPVRIGIHMGDILVTDIDIIGDAVNIASRIESLAIAGSVLISGKVQEEIKNHQELPVKSVGFYSFKNDAKEREVFALDLPTLVVPPPGVLLGKTSAKHRSKIAKAEQKQKKIRLITLRLVALLAIGLVIGYFLKQRSELEWARNEAPIKIQELLDQGNDWEAFRIWELANEINSQAVPLTEISRHLVRTINLHTKPAGVSVYRKPAIDKGIAYELIGTTPLKNKIVFSGTSIWMFTKAGFDTLYQLVSPSNLPRDTLYMPKKGEYPDGMIKVLKNNAPIMIPGIDHLDRQEVSEFYADNYEVTNKAFKEFVDQGGYQKQEYWVFPFEKEGSTLTWKEAMTLFKDGTGETGPATWEFGDFPDGTENFPVTGISWYEAAAFAQYTGKELPTIYHWNLLACTWYSELIVPLSNLEGSELAEIGQFKGMSSNGIFDIAGNAREWCFNSSNRNEERFILGGAWTDGTYAFTDAGTANPWDRSPVNGFRCIKPVDPDQNIQVITQRIDFYYRDFLNESILNDAEFDLMRRQFDYDKDPLNEELKLIEVGSDDWTVEEITFDAAYGEEKMKAYLYLPINGAPPYQTVVFFPGSSSMTIDQFNPEKESQLRYLDYIIKSGRALLFPIYQSTYHRRDKLTSDYPNESNYYKERFIMWGKDLRRSIDYLQTRVDIDKDKIAYFGYSWGASNAGMMGAIEPRLKCLILMSGGLYLQPAQKEADMIHYLSRVKQPVLMLNGRHDMFYPLKSSQTPLFQLFGTDPKDKQHKLYNVNHRISRDVLIKEVLEWLNTYLGEI